jgi:hypothetical protein
VIPLQKLDAFSYNMQQARRTGDSKTSREEPKGEEKRENKCCARLR